MPNGFKICNLLNIKYPIVQGGMIWCSGWELAAAVSNAGGLGVIGSGSMYPDVLRDQIKKCKEHTHNPFAVNLPLLYPDLEQHVRIIIEEKVPVVITSAGNPTVYTSLFKEHNLKVMHVIANVKFAQKAEKAGVDAVIAEGFEAGGHNGKEETTTLCLIPLIKKSVKIPVIAAGGIGSGSAMAAVLCLGADGVQMGSRFAATFESSAHIRFKEQIISATEGSTQLTLKELTPVRLIKNKFYQEVELAYSKGADIETLKTLLGRGRAKKGMFEGDIEEGELEIGQVSAQINELISAKEVVENTMRECHDVLNTVFNQYHSAL
jgi:enoyl-[acyl-carrier protein] reductase II